MGTGLWGHRISCVYPADKDVGKEQSPMKIQEVIDEVNEAWGEEHEEKTKKRYLGITLSVSHAGNFFCGR